MQRSQLGLWLPAIRLARALLTLIPIALAANAQSTLAAVQELAKQGTLALGTPQATTWRLISGEQPGPTVLLIGGMHGNEPAGARAAAQIAGWPIERGRLIIVERANVLALDANKRLTPGLPKAEGDLNRQFPFDATDEVQGVLPQALWQLLVKSAPDLVIDLHEGFDFTRKNPKSVGSSIIATPGAREHARAMLDALNTTIEDPEKKFVLKGSPIAHSLTRAAHRRLGIPSMIVETTKRDQSLTYRVRQHRILVRRLFVELGLMSPGPDQLIGRAAADEDLAVALYVSAGVSGKGPARLAALLSPEHDFILRRVCASDIRAGALQEFDVVIFPGGSGSGQAKALGVEGRSAVVDFVRGGGGYVGICAGAYLAASNYDWSLHMLDANVIDRTHWRRGRGKVAIEWTSSGLSLAPHDLREDRLSTVLYANGPIYEPANDPQLPNYQALALYRGELHDNGAPRGIMPGTAAIVYAAFGAGRVLCSSPHPEQSAAHEECTRALVRKAATPAMGRGESR